jgi:hypothetical protein
LNHRALHMTEAEFQQLVAAWIARTDAEALGGEMLTAFRELCREQTATHSSAEWRSLFADAAALPVINVKIARCLAPFVEKHESGFS